MPAATSSRSAAVRSGSKNRRKRTWSCGGFPPAIFLRLLSAWNGSKAFGLAVRPSLRFRSNARSQLPKPKPRRSNEIREFHNQRVVRGYARHGRRLDRVERSPPGRSADRRAENVARKAQSQVEDRGGRRTFIA